MNEVINIIKIKTKLRSPESIDAFKYFFIKVLRYFNLTLEDYNNKKIIITDVDYNKLVKHINHKYFLKHITNYLINCEYKLKEKEIDLNYHIKKEEKDLHYITIDELELLYKNANDIERLIILLFITTGMRISALIKINPENVNLKTNLIKTIEKRNKEVTYVIDNKNLRDLIIKTNYFNNPKYKKRIDVYIMIKKLCIKSKIKNHKHIHPHSFRHTYARMLLNNDVNINNVSKLLGHRSLETTENFYAKERIQDVKNRICVPWNNLNKNTKLFPDFLLE